jgi:hypothetical protein
MPIVGVVTCQILELEIAAILSNDPDVSEVWIVHDEFSEELLQHMKLDGSRPVYTVSRVSEFKPNHNSGYAVLIRVMEVGLHSNIQQLKQGVTIAVEEVAPHSDAVLLGYGLCGNALNNIRDLFKDIPIPVMLPMDDGESVDDCVGLIIGGRENYYHEQCSCAGTMFMNAGFSKHWKKIMSSDVPQKLIHKKDRILKRLMGNYERTLLLPTAVMGEGEMRQRTIEFNQKYNLRVETRPGTLTLFKNAWKEVKQRAR